MNINYSESLFYHSESDQESFKNKFGPADQNFNLNLRIE